MSNDEEVLDIIVCGAAGIGSVRCGRVGTVLVRLVRKRCDGAMSGTNWCGMDR